MKVVNFVLSVIYFYLIPPMKTVLIYGVLIIFLHCFYAAHLYSQTPQADSLKYLVASAIFEKAPDSVIINRINDVAYWVRNSAHDTALAYANDALNRAKAVHYVRGQARAKMIIGIVALYEGHYNAGLDAHLEAIELYTSLQDNIQVAFLLNNIGYLYKEEGKLEIAKDYFSRSLAMFREKKFLDGIALVLGNIGDIALKRSEYAEALRIEREALHLGLQLKDRFYANVAYFHLGTIFHAMGQYDSAMSYQKQALERFEADNMGQYIIRSLENLSAIYSSQKRFQEAFRHAERGLKIAESLPASVDLALMNERLSLLYESTGKYDKALVYYRRTASMRDSLRSMNIAERMKTLDMMRVAEKNAKELALSEKEQSRLTSVRNYLLVCIGFGAVLLFLAVHRYRYIARSEASLREVNHLITIQQQQLEVQSKHIQEANTALEASNSELDAQNERLTEANKQLSSANERLAALNYEKDEVLGIVAHDLKNPLTTIMMASSSLAATELPHERVTAFGERILHTSERMLNIITKLLNINSLEQGAKALHIQSVNIVESIRSIIDDHSTHAHSKDLAVIFTPAQESLVVRTDESIVVEIIENILDNALKYSPKGKSVYVSLNVDGGGNELQKALCIIIQDEGPGFNEEDKTKVFGKFARLSAKPTGGEESTGLGLSIVKKLAEMLGGTVTLESAAGNGATFTVILPSVSE